MKKILPFATATAISVFAIISSLSLADPELGISTALLSWMGCLWIISKDRKKQGCLS
ncbi:hypothetical protein [Pedobacter jeongneungensis]|uniref:hypothetical protein n=1 Tax=Pedobacter TaxID=84567 RepID=UPI0031E9FF35